MPIRIMYIYFLIFSYLRNNTVYPIRAVTENKTVPIVNNLHGNCISDMILPKENLCTRFHGNSQEDINAEIAPPTQVHFAKSVSSLLMNCPDFSQPLYAAAK